jgi:tetratricopeptide (TPR) repeat protein
LLQHAAVLGQEFRYKVLLEVSGEDEESMVNSLDRLTDLRVLEEVEVGIEVRYSFTNNMVREVVYNHLSRTKRRHLHKKIGLALENLFKDTPEKVAFSLANHFSMTSDIARALKYNIMAGDQAMASYALNEAQVHYETSLDMLSKLDDSEDTETMELTLLKKLGDISAYLGDWKEALQHFREVLKLSKEGTMEKAMALRAIGEIERERGKWRAATECYEQAIELSEQIGDKRGVANSLCGLAWVVWKLGDYEKLNEYADRAIEVAKGIGDNYLVGRALIEKGLACSEISDQHEKGIHFYEMALKYLDPEKHLDMTARAHINIGSCYQDMGKYERAIKEFDKTLRIAERTKDIRSKAFVYANMGYCHLKTGHLEKASQEFDKAQRIFEKVSHSYMTSIVYYHKGQIARQKGELDKAEVLLKKAITIQEETKFPMGLAVTTREYGLLLRTRGKKEEARKILLKARGILKELGNTSIVEEIDKDIEELDRAGS